MQKAKGALEGAENLIAPNFETMQLSSCKSDPVFLIGRQQIAIQSQQKKTIWLCFPRLPYP